MSGRLYQSVKPGGTAEEFLPLLSQQKTLGTEAFCFVPQYKKRSQNTMSENKIPYKIYLSEDEMPTAWYNLRADMKNKPAPLLNPGTGQPMTAQELEGVFCTELEIGRAHV